MSRRAASQGNYIANLMQFGGALAPVLGGIFLIALVIKAIPYVIAGAAAYAVYKVARWVYVSQAAEAAQPAPSRPRRNRRPHRPSRRRNALVTINLSVPNDSPQRANGRCDTNAPTIIVPTRAQVVTDYNPSQIRRSR